MPSDSPGRIDLGPGKVGGWLTQLLARTREAQRRDHLEGVSRRTHGLTDLFERADQSGQLLSELAVQWLHCRWGRFLPALSQLDARLLHAVLCRSVVCDLALEDRIRESRFQLASQVASGQSLNPPEFALACSIAVHSWNIEYLYDVEPAEEGLAYQIRQRVEQRWRSGAPDRDGLVALAMYDRPSDPELQESWKAFSGFRLNPVIAQLAEQGFQEPWRLGKVEPLESIADPTPAHAVRRSYDMWPYPRWFDIDLPVPRVVAESHDPVLAYIARTTVERPLRILVAGCGTGRHALRRALQYSDVEVVGIDVSPTSLAYAVHQSQRYRCGRISWRLADLTEPSALREQFQVVEVMGVLHHLQEPVAALRGLASVLVRGGGMWIGVYNAAARGRLNAARGIVSRFDTSTLAGIRNARRAVRNSIPEGFEFVQAFRDFYYTSGFVDLLAHPMERSYSSIEVEALLCGAGLRPLGNGPMTRRQRDVLSSSLDVSRAAGYPDFPDLVASSPDRDSPMIHAWATHRG